MRILFDANTPAPLGHFLRGHEVVRADELGWQGLENGALLDLWMNYGAGALCEDLYDQASGYIHLSGQHMVNTVGIPRDEGMITLKSHRVRREYLDPAVLPR